jgi:hypothetical protein
MSFASSLLFSIAMDACKEDLDEARERLEAFELCNDKVTAAALGYLLAKQEEKRKEEQEEWIYDRLCSIINSCIECDGTYYTESAVEAIFEVFYDWLIHHTEKDCEKELTKLFKPYIVQKH